MDRSTIPGISIVLVLFQLNIKKRLDFKTQPSLLLSILSY